MKLFHFHDWTKWEKYNQEFSEYIAPLTKNNWYGYFERWAEDWERRECKLCGKHQNKRIKTSLFLDKQNGKVTVE